MRRKKVSSLQTLAADACLNGILSTRTFKLLHYCIDKLEQFMKSNKHSLSCMELKTTVDKMGLFGNYTNLCNYWRAQLKRKHFSYSLNGKTSKVEIAIDNVIENSLKEHSLSIDSEPVDIMMHMLLNSDTIRVHMKHVKVLIFIFLMGFPIVLNKKELIVDGLIKESALKTIFNILNDLKVIEFDVDELEYTTFDIIRQRNSSTLEVLSIGSQGNYTFNDDQYSKFLFSGQSLKEVRESYVKCKDVKLSFPKLKSLRLPLDGTDEHYNFLRVFLHYYPNVNLDWPTDMKDCVLSPFDGVVSYTVDLNPNHAIDCANLLFEDLRFPYITEILIKWKKLNSLVISLRKTQLDFDIDDAAERLNKILSCCQKLTSIKLIVLHTNVIPHYEILMKSFRKHGKRITKFSIFDKLGLVKDTHIVYFLKSFPILSELNLEIRLHDINNPQYKLKRLKNLKILRYVAEFAYEDHCYDSLLNRDVIIAILNNSPSLAQFDTNDMIAFKYFGTRFPNRPLDKASIIVDHFGTLELADLYIDEMPGDVIQVVVHPQFYFLENSEEHGFQDEMSMLAYTCEDLNIPLKRSTLDLGQIY